MPLSASNVGNGAEAVEKPWVGRDEKWVGRLLEVVGAKRSRAKEKGWPPCAWNGLSARRRSTKCNFLAAPAFCRTLHGTKGNSPANRFFQLGIFMSLLVSSALQRHSSAPAHPPESRRRARVLAVEADAAVSNICRKALEHERLEVRLVSTPLAAWEMLRDWRPQFLLVGDEFPECSGLELVGEMRSKTNTPIVLVSATDSVGYLSSCLEAGADDVIVRPLTPPILPGKCQAQLRRAYRYSVPPASARAFASSPATPAPVNPLPAPVPPEADAPISNFSSWPQCEECNYLGPPARFQKRDPHGFSLTLCPACDSGSIRFPVG